MHFTRRGFTLVELLTVIAIIGILASIVIANLSGARGRANDARRISDMKNIQLALAQYYNDNLFYPTNIYNVFNSSDGVNPSADGLTGAYMSKVPNDPVTNIAYPFAPYLRGASAACGAVNFPAYYHMGAILENSTSIPTDDADVGTNPAGYGICSTFVGFDGNTLDCAATGGGDKCYDVAP